MLVILLLSLSATVADDFELPPDILFAAIPAGNISIGFYESGDEEMTMVRHQSTVEEFPGALPPEEVMDDDVTPMGGGSGGVEFSPEIWSNSNSLEELGDILFFRSEADPCRLLYLVTDDPSLDAFMYEFSDQVIILETLTWDDTSSVGDGIPLLQVLDVRTDSLSFDEWLSAGSQTPGTGT